MTNDGASVDEPIAIPPAQAAQISRANSLLELAAKEGNRDRQFALHVGALHLARSIPEHWFTTAEQIPISLNKQGRDAEDLKQRLRGEFEAIFSAARRFELLSELRSMDYHFEPLRDPFSVAPSMAYGRGRPMKLSAGPGPGSATLLGGNQLFTSGSGRRVGRKNYYQIQQNRFVDPLAGEALPLDLAIRQFLEDMPDCIRKVFAIPEVIEWIDKG